MLVVREKAVSKLKLSLILPSPLPLSRERERGNLICAILFDSNAIQYPGEARGRAPTLGGWDVETTRRAFQRRLFATSGFDLLCLRLFLCSGLK